MRYRTVLHFAGIRPVAVGHKLLDLRNLLLTNDSNRIRTFTAAKGRGAFIDPIRKIEEKLIYSFATFALVRKIIPSLPRAGSQPSPYIGLTANGPKYRRPNSREL